MSITAQAAAAPTASLDHYAALLRALLPRAASATIFNARGDVYWSTEIAVDREIIALVAQATRAAEADLSSPGMCQSLPGVSVYMFWLRGDAAAAATPFATLALAVHVDANEARSFAFVHQMVRPALECLRRELLARDEIQTLHSSLLEQDHDLETLLSISGGGPDAPPGGVEDLKSLLASATVHLKVGMAALIVPEKGVALMHAAPDTTLDHGLLAKAHRHLLSITQMRREPVIINQMQMPTNTAAAYRLLACPITRPDGRSMGVLALFRCESAPEFTPHHGRLTELLARRIATVIANSYDALTGLLTRPALEQRARQALDQPQGVRVPWSALYIDVDRMHVINDSYGMHMGDRVISQLGELIRRRMPPGSFAARISGDRFAVLLPAALADAGTFAESLRQGAEQLGNVLGDGKMQVSTSIGVAALEVGGNEFSHVFALAETACKAANDRGRNRVELYQQADKSIVQRFNDINLASGLRSAIAEDRLQLFAQLIVPLQDRRRRPHFELLLRMINENGETVGPDHFMSAAQRYQLMPMIDRWVIRRATELLKPHASLLASAPVVFTINFSGQSLQDAEFTDVVVAAIVDSGLNPAAFCFELTESAAIGNLARAEILMRKLRKLGCNIALDDFGTGLSSLAYLRALPIGMLKIDGSFIRDVLKDARADSMVQAIAQLARSMSLTTVAEYVETDEIRARITALGVDYGQGFSIAQPVPLADVLSELSLYAAAATTEVSGVWTPEDQLAQEILNVGALSA